MQSEINTRHLNKKRFWIFVAFTVVSFLVMRFVSEELTGKAIIEFEMAKTVDAARVMLDDWKQAGISQFLRSTYIDFLFIIGYVGLLFYGCRYFGHLSNNFILHKAGGVFSFLSIVAGICDLLENIGMIYTVKIEPIGWITHLTYDLARIKFSLIFILLVYLMICLLFWAIDKLSNTENKLQLKQ